MRSKLKWIAVSGVILLVGGGLAYRYNLIAIPGLDGGMSPSRKADLNPASLTTNEGRLETKAIAEFPVGKNGRPMFVMGNIKGQPVRFLIDTGCSRSGLDERYRPLLGDSVGYCALHTPAGKIERETFGCSEIQLGELSVRPTKAVVCFDFRDVSRAAGVDFGGVIGMDVLGQYVVQIDFDNGVLRLFEGLPQSPDRLGVAMPLTYDDDVPMVSATSGSISGDFIIDTGSTNTCIRSDSFVSLAQAGMLDVGELPGAVMTGRGYLAVKTGLLQSLTLDRHVHKEVLCDNDFRNMLGLRYLSRYLLTFDFPRDVAYFREGTKYSAPDARGISGIRPIRNSNGFEVTAISPQGPAEGAGIHVGDQIVELDGQPATEIDMFRMGEMLTSSPGREVKVKLNRGDQEVRTSFRVRDRFR